MLLVLVKQQVLTYLDEGNPLSEQWDGDDENESSSRLVDGSVGRNSIEATRHTCSNNNDSAIVWMQ